MEAKPEMTAESLLTLLELLERHSIPVWLDGGWGVDALLGEETRKHKDVDIIPRVTDVPKLQEVLGRQGFRVKEGQPPHTFVLSDGLGLEVDVHAVSFDKTGNGHYRMENGETWVFPAEGFSGRGRVAGKDVACLSAEVQVLCHAQGYEPVEKDFNDMERLAARFNLALPPQLQRPPKHQGQGPQGEG